MKMREVKLETPIFTKTRYPVTAMVSLYRHYYLKKTQQNRRANMTTVIHKRLQHFFQ